MRIKTLTTTDASGGATFSSVLPVNWRQAPFNIGVQVDITGTASVTVQITMSDILGGETPVWLPHATLAALTADTQGAITSPVTGIRITQASGAGSSSTKIIQGNSE
jgi:hypothetical protein